MEIPLGSLVTAIATVVCVVVANTLTLHRSHKEKTWDLRRQAYGAILSALGSVERICDSADEYIREDSDRYFREDYSARHNEQIAEHMSIARQRFSDDYLVFSDEFVALFEEFLKGLDHEDPWSLADEQYEAFAAVLRKYRPLLLTKARREIAVGGRWRPAGAVFTRFKIPVLRVSKSPNDTPLAVRKEDGR
jgi:hypothetical protein